MDRASEEVMSFLVAAESAAEDVLADRQAVVELDRRRNKNREALRVLRKDKSSSKQWVCFGNMFIKMHKTHTQTVLQKDSDSLDSEISDLRSNLKVKVNKLRDLENKEALKGFDLQPLTREEMRSIDGVL